MHDRWDGDAAAYALHALEQDEARAFEEHLAGCRRCQDELESFRQVVAALPPRLQAHSRARAEAAGAGRRGRRRRSTIGFSGGRAGGHARTTKVALALRAVVPAQAADRSHRRGRGRRARWSVGLLTLGGGSSTQTYAGVVHASGASASVVRVRQQRPTAVLADAGTAAGTYLPGVVAASERVPTTDPDPVCRSHWIRSGAREPTWRSGGAGHG